MFGNHFIFHGLSTREPTSVACDVEQGDLLDSEEKEAGSAHVKDPAALEKHFILHNFSASSADVRV